MEIFKTWDNLLNSHIDEVVRLTKNLTSICGSYEKSKKEVSDVGFNIFKLTSDLYYRENFHSDIIKAFLDPQEKHGETNTHLNIFIEMLGLNTADFEYSEVKRESNNIDILIANKNSGKAIIIENKINNASDMPRQLPRYLEIVKEKDYQVDAIIYIPLDISKSPDKSTWSDADKKNVEPLLRIIPAFCRDGTINLLDHWIMPSIIESNNIDSVFILRQYGNLLKHLNTSAMDTISMEKFYSSLKEDNNLQTAISIRNMLNDLPSYMALKIQEKYKNCCDPFGKIWIYKNTDAVFEGLKIFDLYFKMDIWCNENGYDVYLWNPNDELFDILAYFKNIEILNDFKVYNSRGNNIIKHFNIFDEKLLFEFVDSILKSLHEFKDSKIKLYVETTCNNKTE